jgi:hypothetical protein
MVKKHMKKCTTSVAIKVMQTTTTLRVYLTLVRMVAIKNTIPNKCWKECGGAGVLYTAGGNVN